MSAGHRTRAIPVVLAGLFWATACESPGGPVSVIEPPSFVVSNPVASLPAAAAAVASAGAAAAQSGVVYVALPPGSIPNAQTIDISVRPRGTTLTVRLLDGGFDPVPVPAVVGDTVEIDVRVGGTPSLRFLLPVPAERRPVVIRTYPPKGKRDVPLNTTLRIVFSEPIDLTSLTATSLSLATGGTSIPGRFAFADSAHLAATFTPDVPLAPGTDYELTITQNIRDLDGASLEAPLTVQFTTTGQLQSATELVFSVQPTSTDIGKPFVPAVQVVARDRFGQTATDFSGTVLLFLSEGVPAVLLNAEVTAVNGVATFPNLRVSQAGKDFRLTARALSLAAVSTAFDIIPETVSGQIAFVSSRDSTHQIYVINGDGSGLTRLTNDASHNDHPAWSPDGSRIAFTSNRSGVSEIYVMNSDGSGVVRLTSGGAGSTDPAWSPDGTRIAFARYDSPFTGAIAVMNADGSGVKPLTQGSQQNGIWDRWPAWSPDGSKLAFVRNLNDDFTPANIYIMGADGSGAHLLNVQGGISYAEAAPAWSPDGRTILFWSYWADPTFSAGGAGAFALRNSDGSGSLRKLAVNVPVSYWSEPDWSPGGSLIVFASRGPRGFPDGDIYVVLSDGTGTIRLTSGGFDSQPAWRPRP